MRTIILLAILGSALAVPRNIQRIVGGEATTIETYPFMTNLQFHWFGLIWLQGCGGSLITPVTVVTAAHCVEYDPPSQVRIVVGSTLISGAGGDFHGVSNIVIHPEYENVTALDADVAILHLVNRTVLSNRIQTIPIASAATVLGTGLPVTTIGWGALNYQGQSPQLLQHVHVYITDRERCAQVYDELRQLPGFSGWPKVTDYMVCAGIENVGGKDGCQGDSGGPVVYRAQDANILVAITSWGYQCALPTHPGVLVNVPKFTNWIIANA